MTRPTSALLPPLLALAALLAPALAVAAANDWSTAVVVTESTDVSEQTVNRLITATVDACYGTALWVKRTPDETEAELRKAGLNPRACGADVPCLAKLGRALQVRYLVAIGAARLGSSVAITVHIADASWERTVGQGERALAGDADWTEVMVDVVTQALPVPMRKPTGTLSVTSNVEKSEVTVDGRQLGTTPLKPLPIGPGEHEVVVTRDGYPPFKRKVEMEPGGDVKVDAKLVMPAPEKKESFFTGPRIGAIAAGTVAVAALGVGVAYGVQANSTYNTYLARCADILGVPCTDHAPHETDEMKGLRADFERERTIANVAYVTGVVAAAGAAGFLIYDLMQEKPAAGSPEEPQLPSASALGVGVGPSSAVVTLSGTF